MECEICGATEDLIKVRNEQGKVIHLCESCYENEYPEYERIPEEEPEEGLGEEEWEEEGSPEEEEEDWEEEEDEEES